MLMRRLIFCAAFVSLASGCEPMQPWLAKAGYTHNLGDFKVEQIDFVEKMPGPGDGYDGGGHLRLKLVSASKLSLDYPTYWIGVASDFCPLNGDNKLISLGFFEDNLSFWDHSRGDPIEKSADGLYRYQIYVVRSYPPIGKTRDDFGGPQAGPYAQAEYDIINNRKDLCLQIYGGDHYNVFARSSLIRVAYEDIRNAAIEASVASNP